MPKPFRPRHSVLLMCCDDFPDAPAALSADARQFVCLTGVKRAVAELSERLPPRSSPEEAGAVGHLMERVPPERMAEILGWVNPPSKLGVDYFINAMAIAEAKALLGDDPRILTMADLRRDPSDPLYLPRPAPTLVRRPGIVAVWLGVGFDPENHEIGGFDEDDGEGAGTGTPTDVATLLAGFSWAESWQDAAVEAASELGVSKASRAFAVFDSEYPGRPGLFNARANAWFLGNFLYSR